MSSMWQGLGFFLGGFLAVQAFAALFLLVDLKFAGPRYWPRIAGPILGWWLAVFIGFTVLPSSLEKVYVYGVGGVGGLQIVSFFLARWLMSLPFRVG